MLCPFDSTPLQAVNRHGVEIDWCPSCKGVWLERGELDKLIERAAESDSREPRWVADARHLDARPRTPSAARNGDRSDTPRKKKSFLSDLFEFGGD